METTLTPQQRLLNELAPLRHVRAVRMWLAALEASTRFSGADAENLERNALSLAQLKQHAADIDAAAKNAPDVTQCSRLYDRADLLLGEMILHLLDTPAGRAGLKAIVEQVANEAGEQQAAAAARRAAETEVARREHDAKLDSEAAATSAGTVLNALAARGVIVTANSAGGIDCRPSGSLSILERRVLTEKKGDVLRLLAARDAVETL